MEVTAVTSIAISFAFAAILACVWKVVDWVWLQPKKTEKLLRQQGLSGNSYKLLYGDMKEIYSMAKQAKTTPLKPSCHDIGPRILPFFHQTMKKYGKKSFVWLGPKPSINIAEPKLIKEIFSDMESFQKPKFNPLVRIVVNGMVMHEGERWWTVRKICNPAFHLDKLKGMIPKMYLSCNELISKWKTLISNKDSCELDVWPDIKFLTGDVISRTVFGSSYEDGRKIFELIREQVVLLTQVNQSVYIPGWRFMPTKLNRKLKSNSNQIIALIEGIIIKKKQEALKAGEADTNDDLLGLLLESNRKEIQEHGNDKNNGMSIEEVIDECKLFYVAGQETTASFISWTMVLLSVYQNWQERAREEVFQVFGNKEPRSDELNQLKELTKIMHESIRLYTPAHMFSRVVAKETKVGGINVPSGTILTFQILAVHVDEEYWGEDAKEFNPDRFSQGVSKASKSSDQVPFFPFGWGPRICIGNNFAMLEAKLALAMLLQNFRFQLSPTYVHAPVRGISLDPQHGIRLVLHKL